MMWSKKEWLVFLVSFILIALFTKTSPGGWNDASRLAAIQSIVENSTFAIDNSIFAGTMDKVRINNHYYSSKPALSYLISAPVYFILYNSGLTFANAKPVCYFLITLLTVGLTISIMLVCFFKLLKNYNLNLKERIIYTAGLGMGTLIFPYSLVLNSHALGAALIFIGIYLMLTAKTKWQYTLAGFMAGLAASIEEAPGGIFFILSVILIYRKSKISKATAFFIAGIIPIIIYLLINFSISGNVLPFHLQPELYDYKGSVFSDGRSAGMTQQSFTEMLHYAFVVIIGQKGIFRFNPLLLFSIVGLILAIINKNKSRDFAIIITVGIIMTILFYIARTDQYGGCNFGFRYFIPLIPLLYYFTPLVFKKTKSLGLRYLFIITFMFSIFIAFMGIVLGPWTCSKNMIPDNTLKEIFLKFYNSLSIWGLF